MAIGDVAEGWDADAWEADAWGLADESDADTAIAVRPSRLALALRVGLCVLMLLLSHSRIG